MIKLNYSDYKVISGCREVLADLANTKTDEPKPEAPECIKLTGFEASIDIKEINQMVSSHLLSSIRELIHGWQVREALEKQIGKSLPEYITEAAREFLAGEECRGIINEYVRKKVKDRMTMALSKALSAEMSAKIESMVARALRDEG